MPIYEYECPVHKLRIEVTRKITDPEVIPQCRVTGSAHAETEKMERVISTGTSFILKGGSWAKDGYSSKGKK